MRIHIHIPVSSTHQQTTTFPSTVPEQLAELTPHGEPILIEIQGSLDIDTKGQDQVYDDDDPDQVAPAHILGSLSWERGFSEHPVLTISRHKLQGKVMSLQKPLAILQKKQRVQKRTSEMNQRLVRKRPRPSSPGEQDEPEEVLRSDDPQTPERTKRQLPPYSDAADFSSSPLRMGGAEPAPHDPAAYEDDDTLSSTPTYYEVISLIRKKIVFSKRPEPIVH